VLNILFTTWYKLATALSSRNHTLV